MMVESALERFTPCAGPGPGCVDAETCASHRKTDQDPGWCLYRIANEHDAFKAVAEAAQETPHVFPDDTNSGYDGGGMHEYDPDFAEFCPICKSLAALLRKELTNMNDEKKFVDELEVFEGKSGEWYYRGKSNNGEILFTSESYTEKATAMRLSAQLADQLGVWVSVHGS